MFMAMTISLRLLYFFDFLGLREQSFTNLGEQLPKTPKPQNPKTPKNEGVEGNIY